MLHIYDASLQLSLTNLHEVSSLSTTEHVCHCVKAKQGVAPLKHNGNSETHRNRIESKKINTQLGYGSLLYNDQAKWWGRKLLQLLLCCQDCYILDCIELLVQGLDNEVKAIMLAVFFST